MQFVEHFKQDADVVEQQSPHSTDNRAAQGLCRFETRDWHKDWPTGHTDTAANLICRCNTHGTFNSSVSITWLQLSYVYILIS